MNLVIHESNLPKGRGFAPVQNQILQNKSIIPVVLFEATNKIDEGSILLKDKIVLNGTELNREIRDKQAEITIKIIKKFLSKYPKIVKNKQTGKPTYYKKRSVKDSKLDINKTIKSQFNLLRIVDNEKYPAYFIHKNRKYVINIFKKEKWKIIFCSAHQPAFLPWAGLLQKMLFSEKFIVMDLANFRREVLCIEIKLR